MGRQMVTSTLRAGWLVLALWYFEYVALWCNIQKRNIKEGAHQNVKIGDKYLSYWHRGNTNSENKHLFYEGKGNREKWKGSQR